MKHERNQSTRKDGSITLVGLGVYSVDFHVVHTRGRESWKHAFVHNRRAMFFTVQFDRCCVPISFLHAQESMQKINGALREHVLGDVRTCPVGQPEEALAVVGGAEVEGARDGSKAEGRCWLEDFIVDIRYDTSSDQVCALYVHV